jgi:hypothetical protein
MTIEAWNIVLSSVILVVMAGVGYWLKYVVEQQLKSKDTTIEALKGVVQLKDAHIESLQGNTAPAIVKAYADMREHANSMTEESQRLSVQLGAITKKQKVETEMLLTKILLSEVRGLELASDLLEKHVWKLIIPDGHNLDPKFESDEFEPLLDGISDMYEHINSELKTRLDQGSNWMQQMQRLLP